jgi:predicted phosphodiesterase
MNNTSYGFQLASDIHIEKRFPENLSITDFITPCCSTLILAGDIGSIYYEDQLRFFFESCSKNFETVIFVPGNNEYYAREGHQQVTFTELNIRLANICADTNIILLNNSYLETDDLIIFGSTWWSGIPDQLNMRIKIDEHQITPDEFNCLHYIAKINLNRVIDIKGSKRLLVITHYCPSKLGTMNSHHKKDDFVSLVPYYFASSEKYLKAGVVDTWVFGHTHVFRDFIFDRSDTTLHTRIISNADPRKKFFRPNFTFEV